MKLPYETWLQYNALSTIGPVSECAFGAHMHHQGLSRWLGKFPDWLVQRQEGALAWYVHVLGGGSGPGTTMC